MISILFLFSPVSDMQVSNASVYHPIKYKYIKGVMPFIHQITDTKPYGMNGINSGSAVNSVMVCAYYGILQKKTDALDLSGYGYYVCMPYKINHYSFSETSKDPDGKEFSGAYGFIMNQGKSDSISDRVATYLRAHGLLINFVDKLESSENFYKWIVEQIDKSQPVFFQYNEHSVIVNGYGFNSIHRDILSILDPVNQRNKSIHLDEIDFKSALFASTISVNDPIQVVCESVEVKEKPSFESKTVTNKTKGTIGSVKMHNDYDELCVNESSYGELRSWYYIRWEDSVEGWVLGGKNKTSFFDYYEKPPPEDPNKDKVTVTLSVHSEKFDGPLLTGVMISGYDGKDKTFKHLTNKLGYASITGTKGNWKFSLSFKGYVDKTWQEVIEFTESKDVFILKDKNSEENRKPDLVCKSIRIPASFVTEGSYFYVHPVLKNIGNAKAERSHVKVLLSLKDDTVLSDDIFYGEGSASTMIPEEQDIPTITTKEFPHIPGDQRQFLVWIIIIVDSNNEIDEFDENNIYKCDQPVTYMRKKDKGKDGPCDEPDKPPAGKASLLSPCGGERAINKVTFSWKSVPCAKYYTLFVFREDGSLAFAMEPIFGVSHTTIFNLMEGKYYWKIRASNDNGNGPISDSCSFYIQDD